MLIQSLVTTMALVLAPPSNQATIAQAEPTLEECNIHLIQDLPVPASDPGVLISLDVKPGMAVEKGMTLATIDDRQAQAVLKVARLDYQIAQQAADSDVDVQHAIKAAAVAEQAHRMYETIRKSDKRAISQIEYLKYFFEWERAKLTIEKAQEEGKAAQLMAQSKKAEADAAEVAVKRRTLVAPFNGIVAKTYVDEGAWLQPGDPVLQLVSIDKLRVIGDVDALIWTRADIEDRKVSVTVTLPRGAEVTVPGKIVYVSPLVGLRGKTLEVWADIDTPMEKGRPLVYAGMPGRMTIHTNQPALPKVRPVAAPAKRRETTKR